MRPAPMPSVAHRAAASVASVAFRAVLASGAVAAPSLAAPGPAVAQVPATFEARMAAVERGLVPPVLVEGRQQPALTLEDRMEHYRVPGVSVAVIHDGKIDWAKSYGLADVASGRKVTLHTLFQAASMSKPVAALAALQLVERGRLSLDEGVNGTLKAWKVPENELTAEQPVTLRELLTHSAGLTVHGFRGYAAGEAVPTVLQVLDGAGPANSAPIRVDIRPGGEWRYSGGGYTVMQEMVSEVAGAPFATVMRRRVLDPLGMRESTYEQPLPEDRRAVAATGYRSGGAPVEGGYHTYPEMAAAGLWTTPSDYARYILGIQATLAGSATPVISRETAEAMVTPGLGNWGLGPGLAGEGDALRFVHGGANEGFRSEFVGYARRGEGVVVMTNSDGGSPLAREIVLGVAKVYGWTGLGPEMVHAVALTPAEADAYVGEYRVGPTVITVRREGDTLRASQNDSPTLEMVPLGDDAFLVVGAGQRVSFERDEEGAVVALMAGATRVAKVR